MVDKTKVCLTESSSAKHRQWQLLLFLLLMSMTSTSLYCSDLTSQPNPVLVISPLSLGSVPWLHPLPDWCDQMACVTQVRS